VEVADLLHAHGDRFIEKNRSWLSYQKLNALRAMKNCRTAALGGHVDRCSKCGHQAISYNSCRNRHCNKCQAQARERWLDAREQELLGVSYFHVVFTLPQELNRLCERHAELIYNLLFRASAETMIEVAADPKHLGAHIGFLSILHTWGQNLSLHPHVHCVVPAGGFSLDRKRWVHPKYAFFLPVKVLGAVFRGKFLDRLKRAYRRNKLSLDRRFIDKLFQTDWVVYAKPAFGGPEAVLRYLGRYTHRVAISNHRLVAFDGGRVTFRWKDYAHGNKQRLMTLHATEFLRRYVQHILPRGFVRIRHYGYLGNHCRSASITLVRKLLGFSQKPREPDAVTKPVWPCPHCGGAMQLGPNFTAAQLVRRCAFIDSS
jgi:hypothetical protein